MRRKILLLANYSSGTATAKNRVIDIITDLALHNIETTVFPVIPSRHLTSEEIFNEIEFDFDGVICLGGDGTLHHLINSLQKKDLDVPIGYFPTGSTNDFSYSLYGTRNPDYYDICRYITRDSSMEFDLGIFNDEYFNYIAAFGAFTDVSYETDQNVKNVLGYLAYVISALGNLPDALKTRTHAVIEANGEIIDDYFLMGGISNTTSIGGLDVPIVNHADLSDGLFEVTLIVSPKNVLELNEIATQILSGNITSPLVRHFVTDHLKINFDEEVPWTLDGENGGKWQNADVRNLPLRQKMYVNK